MQLILPAPPQLLKGLARPLLDEESGWIERARVGDVGALDALMNAHRGRILNLAFQILGDAHSAEDAAQETFLRAFSSLRSFRGSSGFGTWLYRIAVNVCLEKKRALKPHDSLESVEQNLAPPCDGDLKLALDWALSQLSEPHRVALILREWHGLSYEEIASVCAVPVGTVRSRLHEAKIQFRALWLELEKESA